MGKLTTDFNVNLNNNYGRPCLISKPIKEDPEHKEKAMFHEWFVTEDVVSPRLFNTSKNPLPWGQHSSIVGLVELEDGRMTLITPRMITFTDDKVNKLFSDDDIYTIGSNFTAGLSNGIEKTACVFDKKDQKYPKHVEEFIKSCSFTIIIHNYYGPIAIKYITIKRFIEALEEYFNYKWNEDDFCMPVGSPSEAKLEEFIYYTLTDYDNLYISDLSTTRDCIVSKECAAAAFKRYFDYEWDNEIYDKY